MPSDLTMINYHGWQMLQSEARAVGPYFSNTIMERINQKKATNIVFTGEAGIGKSYMAITAARIIEGIYKSKDGTWKDRFTIDQVVFNFSDFMELVMTLKSGKIIIFDEPSYAIGKREWYKKLNQALTKTIESFRFKVHPLFLPVINKSLLDKTIRDHLVQFQVNITERGKGTVYRLLPSQFKEKTFHETFCELHYLMMDQEQCQKNLEGKARKSCLGCKLIESCEIFRAQYERKKRDIQDARYEQAKENAEKSEAKILSVSELEKLSLELKDQWLVNDRVNVQKLRTALSDSCSIQLSLDKAYRLRSALETHNKEILER